MVNYEDEIKLLIEKGKLTVERAILVFIENMYKTNIHPNTIIEAIEWVLRFFGLG